MNFWLLPNFKTTCKITCNKEQKKIIQYDPSFVKTLKKIVISTSFSILAYWNGTVHKTNRKKKSKSKFSSLIIDAYRMVLKNH